LPGPGGKGNLVKKTILAAAFATVLTMAGTGCRQDVQKNAPANGAETRSGSNVTTANQAATSTGTVADTVPAGSLATPTEAYKAAYFFRQRRDIDGLKKVISKDVLDFLTEIGKADNKSLDDMLREMTEEPPAGTPEFRNEKITGERATLEYKDDDGAWKTMDLVNEGGDWKLTLPEKGSRESDDRPKRP